MSGDGGVEISAAGLGAEGLDRLAALHEVAFPDSALGSLGTEALVRYYRYLLSDVHEASVITASADQAMVGFLIGGSFHGSTIGFVQSQRGFLVRSAIRRPKVLVSGPGRRAIGLALRLMSRRVRGAEPEKPWRVPSGSFGVLVVAVDPSWRRRGVGAALLSRAEQIARSRGFVAAHLSLDPTNQGAEDFYAGQGWTPLELPGDSRRGRLMGKTLDQHGSA